MTWGERESSRIEREDGGNFQVVGVEGGWEDRARYSESYPVDDIK